MTQESFTFVDRVNREGLGNEQWGLLQDTDTKTYFSTRNDISLPGFWLYVIIAPGDYLAFVKRDTATIRTFDISGCEILLWELK